MHQLMPPACGQLERLGIGPRSWERPTLRSLCRYDAGQRKSLPGKGGFIPMVEEQRRVSQVVSGRYRHHPVGGFVAVTPPASHVGILLRVVSRIPHVPLLVQPRPWDKWVLIILVGHAVVAKPDTVFCPFPLR